MDALCFFRGWEVWWVGVLQCRVVSMLFRVFLIIWGDVGVCGGMWWDIGGM